MSWVRKQIERLVQESNRRQRWVRGGVIAAVAVALVVTVALVRGATAASVTSGQLSHGTLTGAVFSIESDGNTRTLGQSETVKASSRVQFALSFEFQANSLSTTDNIVTYTLPEGIVSNEVQTGDITGTEDQQNGKKLGTYRIENNTVTLTFDNSAYPSLYNETVDTTVTFWATVQNSSTTESRSYDFNGKGTLTVDPTEPRISISKAVDKTKAYDQWGGETGDLADGEGNRNRHATYTITVESSTGTGHPVTITDAMGDSSNVSATSYDSDSFKLMKYTSAEDKVGSAVSITEPSTSGGSFTLSGLPALSAGERYVLTYAATVTEIDHSANSSQTNNARASIDETSVSQSASATASWANQGDLSISKTARLTDYVNPNNEKERKIQYQIVVTTQRGSGTRIQIGDTAQAGTNIDTSSWSGHVTESFYDHDSFALRKYTGTYTSGQTIDPSGGTDASAQLGQISWNNDSGRPSIGIPINEPLNAGEYYVLTYTATVYESDHTAPDTTMNNTAAARIYPGGRETRTGSASAPVTWHNEIRKSGTFDNTTGYINWTVQVNRNNGSAVGLVMEDTLQNDLVSNVLVYRDTANGSGNEALVQTIDLLSGGQSVDTTGVTGNPSTYDTTSKKLHVVLGSWASANRPYTIKFSTKAPADGTVSNSAAVIMNGTTYGSQGINVGVTRETQWGIAKTTGTNSGSFNSSNGTYTMSWNATATFPDRDLSPDGDNGVLKLTDTLGEVTQPDGTSVSGYTGLHYAIARDLYAELTGSSGSGTTVSLSLHNDADANGNARTYTLSNGVFSTGSGSDAVTLSHVELNVTMQDVDGNTISDPSTSDLHVKSFDLVLTTDDGSTINGRSLTVTGYHTIVNASSLPPSTDVSVGNSLASNQTQGATSGSQSLRTLSSPLEKQVRTLVSSGGAQSRGEGSSGTFVTHFDEGWSGTISGDKDATSGSGVLSDNSDGHSANTVQFRIAVNTTSMDSNAVVTVTDTLPEGLSFLNSRYHPVRLTYTSGNGTYREVGGLEDGNNPTGGDYMTTRNVNISSDGRTLTFKFTLGKTVSGFTFVPGQYYITYSATFNDDSAWNNLSVTNRSYTNNATMTSNGTKYSANSTVNVSRTVSPVTKTQRGTLTNDRRAKYQVVLNPGAADLVANSDTVELVDELSDWNASYTNPELDLASVHLYTYNPNASDGIGTELPKSSYSLKYEYADGTNAYRRMRATVPDSTALVLVYDYEIKAGASGDWGTEANPTTTIGNTATFAGANSGKVSESVRRASSGATAGSRAIYLYKVDSDNYANTLGGSKFDLYTTSNESSTWTRVATDIDGGSYDNNGTYQPHTFNLSDVAGLGMHNVLYKLVETQAPTGYEKTVKYVVWLDENQTESGAWTNITGSADGVISAPNLDADGNTLGGSIGRSDVTFFSYYGGNLYVEDQYQSVTVTKNWAGSDGTPLAADDSDLPASVQLQLKQAVEGSNDWTNYDAAVTVTKDDNWQHTWSSLPQTDGSGNAYRYKVEEVSGSDKWKATFLNNDGIQTGNITITNVRQYSLPQTGGVPLRGVLAGGGIMAVGAWLVLAIRRLAR